MREREELADSPALIEGALSFPPMREHTGLADSSIRGMFQFQPIRFSIVSISIPMATSFIPPWGTMMSATRLEGSMN